MILEKILNEMKMIEEAETDGEDRWNTLKGYLESWLKELGENSTNCQHVWVTSMRKQGGKVCLKCFDWVP